MIISIKDQKTYGFAKLALFVKAIFEHNLHLKIIGFLKEKYLKDFICIYNKI